MSMDITQSAAICRILADASRQRLLLLLETEELSVAELTEITGLAQSRVSTHLGKLRETGMVEDRRQGTTVFYSARRDTEATIARLWQALRQDISSEEMSSDRERMGEVLRRRKPGLTWAESVAGHMELHYSPGRTWQATAHALLPLIEMGDVLDIASGDGVLAALLAPRCQTITCVDISQTLVAAGTERLQPHSHARYIQGDMHDIPLPDNSFDTLFLMHALTYSSTPKQVMSEIQRLLRPGGKAIISTLAKHAHQASVTSFDHVNLGFEPKTLRKLIEQSGLQAQHCDISLQESQAPYFGVITALARKPR
ncbi:MAG: ArsR/SmtB family transcription factor [Oceanococcus sp.]